MDRPDIQRDALAAYLHQTLAVERFRDYCPNGLQVEGRARVARIVCGVTACQALIDAAIAHQADALLVHHGWFWKGEDGRITGFRKRRLQTLLAHDINLLAYHLPLDGHPEFGNNAQLGIRLGWPIEAHFADQSLAALAVLPAPTFASAIAAQVGHLLKRTPQLIGDPQHVVQRIAWCSGGAQSYFEQAIAAGADLFMSGELSEPTAHLARESGVAYLAAGHHATERYGVMALGAHLHTQFGIESIYVDIDNPA